MNSINDEILLQLKKEYQWSLARNMVLLDELKRVTKTLSENGIKAIPLKGGYLAENVYEDIACRPMSDLDLLVQDCDKEHTFRLLSSLNYKVVQDTPSNRELHETFILDIAGQKVLIEVHNRLVKNKFRKRFDLNEIFELGHIPFPFQLLYLSWHTIRHGVVRFMWLCDMAQLLRQQDSPVNWEGFVRTAIKYKVKQEANFVLYLASSLLATSLLKHCPMEPGKFRRFIFERIFLKGKGDLTGRNETRQRFIMSLVLMKPFDVMVLLPSCVAMVTVENRRNVAPIGTGQGGHK